MEFSEVLSKAWQIIWKHKILWLFGILAGLGGATSSGGSNTGYRFSSGDNPAFGQPFNINVDPAVLAVIVIGVLLVVLVLGVVFILLGTVGRIGLIRGAAQADQGAARLEFGALFREGLRYFWRVFGLLLLTFLVVLIVVPFVGLPLVILTCGIGAIALVLALLILPVIIQMAIIAIVVEDRGVIDGLKRGWELFKTNLGNMILMGLLLFVIGAIGSALVAGPLALIVGPALIGLFTGQPPAFNAGLLISGLCFVGYLPILIFLSGVIRSYVESAWTLTYLRLTAKPAIIEAVAVVQ